MNALIDEASFLSKLARINDRIGESCAGCGRSEKNVRLLPITKTFPLEAAEYAKRAGCSAVGENRVHEAIDKMRSSSFAMEWELVGHLQSNKAKLAAGRFARIQSIDSVKLLRRLSTALEGQNQSQRILLQVNAGKDPAKFGINPEGADALLEEAMNTSCIEPEGLMTIAPLSDDPSVARRCFARLREIKERLSDRFGIALPELSMGMTADFEVAIEEGSTIVRVGSGLFGERKFT
jgi:pyridoxal phosphate enzyme (YggS family)